MFAYGCSSSAFWLVALIWSYFHPFSPREIPPFDDRISFLLAGATLVHVWAGALTWAPYNYHLSWLVPRYPPLFHPDRKKVEWGRNIVLTTTLCAVVTWIIILDPNRDESDRRAVLGVVWSATCLDIGATIAVFWAIRPQYLYLQWMLRFFSWDIDFRSLSQVRARRAAPPFEPWLAALLECCEEVAASPSGGIDCLSLKTEVNAEMESRMCLVSHRRLLTHNGFRVIRRFIQAVEALDCRTTNALAQQSVISCAKQVLESRGGILASADEGGWLGAERADKDSV